MPWLEWFNRSCNLSPDISFHYVDDICLLFYRMDLGLGKGASRFGLKINTIKSKFSVGPEQKELKVPINLFTSAALFLLAVTQNSMPLNALIALDPSSQFCKKSGPAESSTPISRWGYFAPIFWLLVTETYSIWNYCSRRFSWSPAFVYVIDWRPEFPW